MIAFNIFAWFSNSERQSWKKENFFHAKNFLFPYNVFPIFPHTLAEAKRKKRWNQGSVKNEGERWNCETAFRNEEGTLDCDIKKYKNIILFLAILIFLTARVFPPWAMRGFFLFVFWCVEGEIKINSIRTWHIFLCIRKKAKRKKTEAKLSCNHTRLKYFQFKQNSFY